LRLRFLVFFKTTKLSTKFKEISNDRWARAVVFLLYVASRKEITDILDSSR